MNDLLGSDEKVSITQSLGCDKEEAKKEEKTQPQGDKKKKAKKKKKNRKQNLNSKTTNS